MLSRKSYTSVRLRNRVWARCLLCGVLLVYVLAVVNFPALRLWSHTDGSQQATASHFQSRSLLANNTDSSNSNYPTDLFSASERSNGAIVFHVIGVLYMFVALAIVCDDYFVPALEVLTETLDVPEDVAGATFMAAGGSAPELFTSFIGTFIADSDVGFGTIVGSAVFNILFVIGACAMAVDKELPLTWWPLARDSVWYSVFLVLLAGFFQNKEIAWWEALIMFLTYGAYGYFMKYNKELKVWFATKLNMPVAEPEEFEERKRAMTVAGLMRPGSRLSFHTGALRLMMSQMDPKGSGREKHKDTRFKRAAKLIIAKKREQTQDVVSSSGSIPMATAVGKPSSSTAFGVPIKGRVVEEPEQEVSLSDVAASPAEDAVHDDFAQQGNDPSSPAAADAGDEEVPNTDMDSLMTWPSSTKDRIKYVLLAPIVWPLYVTLPSMEKEEYRKYFPITFFGAIMWIGVYSYFMVWWATEIGNTADIPDVVMGLTFLAAGTSVPDLLTSVIVARKGFGDMALSSSIGSNIFDIGVGLPLPWLVYTAINQKAIKVGSDGLFVSVIVLFIMLVGVICAVALNKWVLNKNLGLAMFGMYVLFVTQNLLFELDVIDI